MSFLDTLFCRRSDRERIAALTQQLAQTQHQLMLTKEQLLSAIGAYRAAKAADVADQAALAAANQKIADLSTQDAAFADPEVQAGLQEMIADAAALSPAPAAPSAPAADATATAPAQG